MRRIILVLLLIPSFVFSQSIKLAVVATAFKSDTYRVLVNLPLGWHKAIENKEMNGQFVLIKAQDDKSALTRSLIDFYQKDIQQNNSNSATRIDLDQSITPKLNVVTSSMKEQYSKMSGASVLEAGGKKVSGYDGYYFRGKIAQGNINNFIEQYTVFHNGIAFYIMLASVDESGAEQIALHDSFNSIVIERQYTESDISKNQASSTLKHIWDIVLNILQKGAAYFIFGIAISTISFLIRYFRKRVAKKSSLLASPKEVVSDQKLGSQDFARSWTCPKCGAENPPSTNTCSGCQYSLI
jgi:hypothetical protein